jgi:23S rRNA-/tRNA-specific pseudouridylate synthase
MNQVNYQSSAKEWIATRRSSILDAVSSQLVQKNPQPTLTPVDLLELGCVYVNNERVLDPSKKLEPKDLIRVHFFPRRFQLPNDLKQRVVSESQDYLVVDKPAGIPTEPVVDNVKENLLSAMRELLSAELFSVYGVDLGTAGLVVLAKSEKRCEEFKLAFKEGKVVRTFVAFTEAPVRSDQSSSSIRILKCALQSEKTDLINEGRASWALVDGPIENVYRVEIEQTSGRPGEIRDFLSGLGAPILGDLKRGSNKTLKDLETGKAAPAFCAVNIRL